MGRSHKDRDAPRPMASDPSDEQEQGKSPEVGHGDPLDNEGASENTGQGVVLNEWPADDRKGGEGPSESPPPQGGTK
jgi:hypothetical protein